MSQVAIKLRCDRCGAEEEHESRYKDCNWARLNVPGEVGDHDLCPACTRRALAQDKPPSEGPYR